MDGALTPLQADEVAVVPIDAEKGLVLALGHGLKEGDPVARGLLETALNKAGFLGGAFASKSLLDGSLVRLAPETVARLQEGAVFAKDAQGVALGTLKNAGGVGFTDAVRFLPEAANPVAAGLMLQTMAIQRQLGQIQEALEEIDAKLDTLIKGHQHGVLGSLLSLAEPLEELVRKLGDGHQLTDADEVKVRDYEDVARAHEHQASLWLSKLRSLLSTDDLSLGAQHDLLDALIEKEHVGSWLRVYITSQLTLARARWLRLSRAAVVEDPQWACGLQQDVTAQLDRMANDMVCFASELDRYLRDHDIASGLEELSFGKKRRVRQLRRQLRDVHEKLRQGLVASEQMLRVMLRNAEALEIPERLSRRDVEPWLIRDNVHDLTQKGLRKTAELGAATGASALRSADRLLRRLEERRSAQVHSERSGDDSSPSDQS